MSLEIAHLSLRTPTGAALFTDLNLSIPPGEVLTVTGPRASENPASSTRWAGICRRGSP
ncbi:hypothetical protein FLP41_04235 [Paracoccus marcusii]|uniref:hypothetical protein n=1 Tax=Paracoccus marcusii TaxID=59779 RepID=UPI002ED17C94|nr:hypothetical protein FLP41_04235 [Paracoccus marcusii]